jgi:hypothetical protein
MSYKRSKRYRASSESVDYALILNIPQHLTAKLEEGSKLKKAPLP